MRTLLDTLLTDVIWFLAGFAFLRLCMASGVLPWRPRARRDRKAVCEPRRARRAPHAAPALGEASPASPRMARIAEVIAGAAARREHDTVLAVWRASREAFSCELAPRATALAIARACATACVEAHGEQRGQRPPLEELGEHFARHRKAPGGASALHAALDVLARDEDRPEVAMRLLRSTGLGPADDHKSFEIVAAAFAGRGDEVSVQELLRVDGPPAAVAAIAGAALRALARSASLDAPGSMRLLRAVGASPAAELVAPRAVAALLEATGALGRAAFRDALVALEEASLPLPAETAVSWLRACRPEEGADIAHLVERLARRAGVLPFAVYDSLLKFYASTDGARAAHLFREMIDEGLAASEGFCGSLISRSGESNSVAFAEDVANYLRGKSMMSLALLKTLMKAYASCGLYEKACDVFVEAKGLGIEPDAVMHSCAVKFAVKAGRRDLSEDLFNSAPEVDVHNYMCLMRAAGRDGQVRRAIELLSRLREQAPGLVDSTVCNCALDACVMNGAAEEAERLVEEMRAAGVCNCVTYNTLIKGHLARADHAAAWRCLSDLQAAGLAPDCASFNGFLSEAVSRGDYKRAWAVVEEMDRRGVRLDHYSVSILMKAARRATSAADASRLLKVLDWSGVSVCEDEVLLNTALDACAAHRDAGRLRRILEELKMSGVRPKVQTYGLLIRACSVLRDLRGCWAFWRQMVKERGLRPNNITLSCMLDALISAGCTEEAYDLFEAWSDEVLPNTVSCSTMLKGFANSGSVDKAMALLAGMRARGVRVNHVAYTTLIDTQSRAGNTEQAEELLKQMERDGCEPNTITFSTLLRGHCMKGDLDGALAAFAGMLARGLEADIIVVNTLLDGCVRNSRFELADQLVSELPMYGVEPSAVTISILVKMWGHRHCLDNAFAVVRAHLALGTRGAPLDAKVGNCLVSVCFHNKAPQRALEALAEMKACPRWMGPDASTYEVVVLGLGSAGLGEEAVELVEEACQMACEPGTGFKGLSASTLASLRCKLKCHGLEKLAGRLPMVGE